MRPPPFAVFQNAYKVIKATQKGHSSVGGGVFQSVHSLCLGSLGAGGGIRNSLPIGDEVHNCCAETRLSQKKVASVSVAAFRAVRRYSAC